LRYFWKFPFQFHHFIPWMIQTKISPLEPQHLLLPLDENSDMTTFVSQQRIQHGRYFRAHGIHAGELTNPFLGIDHAWMSGPTFPAHPHAGFSAVSYLFLDSQTWIENRDSLGGCQKILPGGLHWTAAGRGVVHEENPAEPGQTVHMLQIFVNLAQDQQADMPFALALAPHDVPVVKLPGVEVRVPLGEFAGQRSPLRPPTEVQLLDISLNEGVELSVPVAAGLNHFVLPISGQLHVNGQAFDCDGAPIPVMPAQANAAEVRLRALAGPAKAVLMAGAPLNQPVYWHGPFAMASAQALQQAMSAYRRGEFGALR
jgi:redox-sensitive bicupin YhaK (pirin superfamily)